MEAQEMGVAAAKQRFSASKIQIVRGLEHTALHLVLRSLLISPVPGFLYPLRP
jgi:hypothetical protein